MSNETRNALREISTSPDTLDALEEIATFDLDLYVDDDSEIDLYLD